MEAADSAQSPRAHEAASVEAADSAQLPEAPKKAASARRTRKPKVEAATDASEQLARDDASEKKPAPKRRTRKTAAKPTESVGADVSEKSATPAADADAPEKPKRTRSKKIAAKQEEPTRALTEDEAAALIAAARKEAQASAESGSGAADVSSSPATLDASAPYPRRRREKPAAAEGEGHRRPRRSVKAEGGAQENDVIAAAAAEVAKQQDEESENATLFDVPESEMPKLPVHESADARPGRANREERAARGNRDRREGDGDSRGKKKQGDRNDRDNRERGNRNERNHNERNNNGRNNKGNRNNRNNRNREVEPSVTREGLAELKVAELRAKAAELSLDVSGMKKAELVEAVYEATVKAEGFLEVSGVLDILSDGYGFLRTQGYLPSETDCYVGLSLVKRNGLRKGDYIVGQTRPARANEKFAAIQHIISVNGTPVDQLGKRVRFANLTPVYPQERLWMEHGKSTITSRVIDLVAPIGKGQRGLIVSPPKAGKTTILKDIAASISANNPEVHLMCLLIDERPEEVTDMERSIKGEVISSTFDMPADNHIACAEMVIERAKRLVENGQDVVILLDSITRLARAYNLAQPASGRVLSGGVDSTALYPPKKFLGAARNIENGGSLTILASALIDTGSKMDEVIFEEFKGTGNMELKLDRNLADRRIFPAIDAVSSGTRKEELLIDPQLAPLIWAVRRILANMNNTERATDTLIKSIKQTENNQEFLLRMARKAQQNSKVDSLDM